MWVGLVTLFPELFDAFFAQGVARRALSEPENPETAAPAIDCQFFNPRDFTERKHGQVDDKPYGGGPGMVLQPQPLLAALAAAEESYRQHAATEARPRLIIPSPQGRVLDHSLVQELAAEPALTLLCGRYEGIDERVMQRADLEVSVGDFVLTGGELVAQVILDAVSRWLPGTLGNAESAAADSFAQGLLEGPQYTRPERSAEGDAVPDVLLSGDHERIRRYRRKAALQRTLERRPGLLLEAALSPEDRELLRELFAERA